MHVNLTIWNPLFIWKEKVGPFQQILIIIYKLVAIEQGADTGLLKGKVHPWEIEMKLYKKLVHRYEEGTTSHHEKLDSIQIGLYLKRTNGTGPAGACHLVP